MEEILASIRKAIDEDTRFGAKVAADVSSAGALPADGLPDNSVPATNDGGANSDLQLAEDVLELTRGNRAARAEAGRRTTHVALVSADSPGILRPAFGQSRDETVSLSGAVAKTTPLEETVLGPEVEVAVEALGGVQDVQADFREADMAMEQTKFNPRPSGERHLEPVSLDQGSREQGSRDNDPTLKLADVDAVVSAAFDKLANQLADSRRQTTPTLEDLAKELMRPVIKEWLDANLSSIVERMVQAEIERVTRRNGL